MSAPDVTARDSWSEVHGVPRKGDCSLASWQSWCRGAEVVRVAGPEEALRSTLGDVAILRDRTGGTTKPLTMRVFRERVEAGGSYDRFDYGACSCFAEAPIPAVPTEEERAG